MMHRMPLRMRRRSPFLLVCIAGGTTTLLQGAWPGMVIPPTGIMLLIAANLFCVCGLWRWRRLMPLLPTPPWQQAIRVAQRQPRRSTRTAILSHWQLTGLELRRSFAPPPVRPRPLRAPRLKPERRRATQRRSLLSRVRLPFPALDIQFVAPDRTHRLPANEQEIHAGLTELVQGILTQLLSTPPVVVALHDEPRQVTCQLATTTTLSGSQQREIAQSLQAHGLVARWRDVAMLSIRRETIGLSLPRRDTPAARYLWIPVVRTRRGQVWWPLPRGEHLVLAGNAQGPLTGLIQRLSRIPEPHRPPLLVDDADGRLREMNETLAALPVRADALAEARQAQLAARFARERAQHHTGAPKPVLVVVAPSEAIWPDLYPLLAPDSGVQVVLILNDPEPIAALRAVCHRLPVIEIPDPRYPPLPDAFHPAGLPQIRCGQALAWMPGGRVFWRGLPPLVDLPAHIERAVSR